jgi:predicted DNA-binding transcriptional regulator AlpA
MFYNKRRNGKPKTKKFPQSVNIGSIVNWFYKNL